MGVLVMTAYVPKANKDRELREALAGHVPVLLEEGLVTDRVAMHLRSRRDGTYVELFEWRDDDAIRRAHDNPRIQSAWRAIEALADMKPIGSLEEAGKLFSHFDVIEDLRAERT